MSVREGSPSRDQLASALLEYMLTVRSHSLIGHCRGDERLEGLWEEYGSLADTLQLELMQSAIELTSTDVNQIEVVHEH